MKILNIVVLYKSENRIKLLQTIRIKFSNALQHDSLYIFINEKTETFMQSFRGTFKLNTSKFSHTR